MVCVCSSAGSRSLFDFFARAVDCRVNFRHLPLMCQATVIATPSLYALQKFSRKNVSLMQWVFADPLAVLCSLFGGSVGVVSLCVWLVS